MAENNQCVVVDEGQSIGREKGKKCNYSGEKGMQHQTPGSKQTAFKNALITFVIKDPERHNRFPLSNGGLWCLGHGIIITLHTYSCTCMQGKVT